MRHVQKLQLGMALSAILFCLTTPFALLHPAAHEAKAQVHPTVRHVDATDLQHDTMLVLSERTANGTFPVAVMSKTERPDTFETLVHDVEGARRVTRPAPHRTPAASAGWAASQDARSTPPSSYPYILTFYEASGRVHRILYADANGSLLDPKTAERFAAGPALAGDLAELRAQCALSRR
ncbi:hypothetical protein JI721_02410 [Alicyclobacillus cycloheptanicus]|uniref:Uncharacterized protein n=1 Tax=Alicyclobacillus cycloheptanicus TaxID=1457 RepID=A0ABT9XF44_9BACL|nr:hypothetical protein [Alicyclobacillus cycloheptanicus]MDQ0188924.1 hypothetical protein [Alicyclobacillus cycloheptanicus]WDM01727.1 hypothetical protein JI721_02410 [Alicyclobacillus cycloheptanicus]